jgi:hypothetical protein
VNHDPFEDRLSDYVDGEMDAAARAETDAHLSACASCRAALDDLRSLAAAARALRDDEPARDLFPGVRRAIAAERRSRTIRRLVLASAAAVLLAALSFAAGRVSARTEPAAPPRPPARFMLLLREGPGHLADASSEERAAIVDRYRAWARSLLPSGTMLDGAKLDDGYGRSLRPPGDAAPLEAARAGDEIGGFFVIGARDEAEALAVARTCPHLEYGGWIEVRRFETR